MELSSQNLTGPQLDKLPGDILRKIGYDADWKIARNYCKISKRFRELCNAGFWREKAKREFTIDVLIESYTDPYYDYLAAKSRYLMKILNNESSELQDIQEELLNYLSHSYPDEFKTHTIIHYALNDYLLVQQLSKEQPKQSDVILIQPREDEIYSYAGFFVSEDVFDLQAQVYGGWNVHFPTSFYMFIWELGLTLESAKELYEMDGLITIVPVTPYAGQESHILTPILTARGRLRKPPKPERIDMKKL
jgi:hypothetical protein